MKEKIDETIDATCNWIIKEVNETIVPNNMTPDMITALAELVRARAVSTH